MRNVLSVGRRSGRAALGLALIVMAGVGIGLLSVGSGPGTALGQAAPTATATAAAFVPVVSATGTSGTVSVTARLSDGAMHTLTVTLPTGSSGSVSIGVDRTGHVSVTAAGAARGNVTIAISPTDQGAPPIVGPVSSMTIGLDAAGHGDVQL